MTAVAEYPRLTIHTPDAAKMESPAPWSLAERIAFRFCFVYFGLYVLTTQMLGGFFPFPTVRIPNLGEIPPMRPLVMWVGHTLLGVKPTLVPTGSGDTLYDWTSVFTLLLVATVATVVWSVLGRRTTNHERLHKWFRLFIRFALGTTMLSYGFAKVFPLQMPTIFLSRLLEPYGNFSPMGVIWYSIGAAPGYERFIGSAEVLAGVLLFLPRTTLLGGLVTFGVTTGVFMVNMTYDVPVKQFAFHLVSMSIFLIAPDVQRLLNVFLLNRPVAPFREPHFGPTAKSHRIWLGAQVVFALWVLGWETYGGAQSWKTFGGGAPKSALYGIWDVDSMSINGELHPPLTTDTVRYSHAVFQSVTGLTFQLMDQNFVRYTAKIDTVKQTIALKRGADTTSKGVLAYQRPSPTQLALEGDVEGKHLRMAMTLHDLDKFMLVKTGFHWVQQFPVNR